MKFSVWISEENVNKSAENFGFVHIYYRNPKRKTLFLWGAFVSLKLETKKLGTKYLRKFVEEMLRTLCLSNLCGFPFGQIPFKSQRRPC